MSMIIQQYASDIVIDHTENNKSQDFSLNIDKIFNATGWKTKYKYMGWNNYVITGGKI